MICTPVYLVVIIILLLHIHMAIEYTRFDDTDMELQSSPTLVIVLGGEGR